MNCQCLNETTMNDQFKKISSAGFFTISVTFWMLVALCDSSVMAAEAALKIPTSLEGKTYKIARAKILADGWLPDGRNASLEWGEDLQKRYPEVRHCAVDGPFCSLSFKGKNGACLRIITRGEVPEELRVEAVVRECDDARQ